MHSSLIALFNCLAMCTCLQLLSLGMFHFVEAPARRVLRKWLSPPKADATTPAIFPLPATTRAA
jgi:peptidoglycan/LPS O-acetylase OafA/YrhL